MHVFNLGGITSNQFCFSEIAKIEKKVLGNLDFVLFFSLNVSVSAF